MSQSATPTITFPALGPCPLQVDFLSERPTSDDGLPWLAEAGAALELTNRLAAALDDWGPGTRAPPHRSLVLGIQSHLSEAWWRALNHLRHHPV